MFDSFASEIQPFEKSNPVKLLNNCNICKRFKHSKDFSLANLLNINSYFCKRSDCYETFEYFSHNFFNIH